MKGPNAKRWQVSEMDIEVASLDRVVCAVPLSAVRSAVVVAEREPNLASVGNVILLGLLFICERLDSIEISQRIAAEAAVDSPEV